jgi:hypothetical protein
MSQKFAGSIPEEVLGVFGLPDASRCTQLSL